MKKQFYPMTRFPEKDKHDGYTSKYVIVYDSDGDCEIGYYGFIACEWVLFNEGLMDLVCWHPIPDSAEYIDSNLLKPVKYIVARG